ncbi:hypothetical protein ACFYVR_23345 [Rhodococcus sp. NPDC003318]|uniref:hypothetical protein n=1 Tax=Rhodococcus sp. NPDC003318 TaxID=3364503 RepID=UPI00367D2C5B
MSPQRRSTGRGGEFSLARHSGRHTGLVGRLLVVLMLAAVSWIGLGSAVAAASGFECKEVPAPEFPNEVVETNFDSTSADRPSAGGSGYQTYGWAGLKWHTYDLGCGADLVKAPGAVGDTTVGNTFMTIGKSMAAAAFWLDDQTKTGQAAADAGVEPALAEFDQIVYSISQGMRSIYGQWIGIALAVVAGIVLWKALREDSAGVTRTTAFAAAALTLGALMVGAPQKALQVADETFGSLITETQDQIFAVQFGPDGDTLGAGATDPRNVLIDKLYLDDWRKGWFGQNYDPTDQANLGPELRDSLAFTYDEQHAVKDDPTAQTELAERKADKFRDIVASLETDHQLSYYQFQGKDSGRTSIGFMGMLKLAMPSLLWIGASMLKLVALLAIRFAVLFAPIWIPIAIAHGGWLSRVMRMLASAYMWGVAGAVIVALYLMALVQLYVNANGAVDGSWRLWFMIVLTVVCWAIMRPFKRMSQTFTQNSASMVNRKARGAKQAIKRKAFAAAAATVGGPGAGAAAGTIANKASERWGRRTSGEIAGPGGAPTRPEGRALNNQRQQALTKSRTDAHKAQGLGRAVRMGQAAAAGDERDARIAGIAAVTSLDLARGKGEVDAKDADRAVKSGAAAWKRFDQDEADAIVQERKARKELLTASVGQRWDGGDRSAIAPMKVFTPAPRQRQSAHATATLTRSSIKSAPAKVWNASAPSASTPKDRYL